jgi:S1-C subfamily serine protease
MRQSVITATLLITATVTPAHAADWVPIVKDLARKVPRIEILRDGKEDPGTCSAVVINAIDGFALSAAHCFDRSSQESVTLNGRHAEVARMNTLLDLAVLRFEPHGEHTMCLGTEPLLGSETLIVGFAFGSKGLHVQAGNVSNVLDEDRLIVAADVIFGDSGGAAIDSSGCLIGMVSAIRSAGPAHLGLMVPVSTIRDFVAGYLKP